MTTRANELEHTDFGNAARRGTGEAGASSLSVHSAQLDGQQDGVVGQHEGTCVHFPGSGPTGARRCSSCVSLDVEGCQHSSSGVIMPEASRHSEHAAISRRRGGLPSRRLRSSSPGLEHVQTQAQDELPSRRFYPGVGVQTYSPLLETVDRGTSVSPPLLPAVARDVHDVGLQTRFWDECLHDLLRVDASTLTDDLVFEEGATRGGTPAQMTSAQVQTSLSLGEELAMPAALHMGTQTLELMSGGATGRNRRSLQKPDSNVGDVAYFGNDAMARKPANPILDSPRLAFVQLEASGSHTPEVGGPSLQSVAPNAHPPGNLGVSRSPRGASDIAGVAGVVSPSSARTGLIDTIANTPSTTNTTNTTNATNATNATDATNATNSASAPTNITAAATLNATIRAGAAVATRACIGRVGADAKGFSPRVVVASPAGSTATPESRDFRAATFQHACVGTEQNFKLLAKSPVGGTWESPIRTEDVGVGPDCSLSLADVGVSVCESFWTDISPRGPHLDADAGSAIPARRYLPIDTPNIPRKPSTLPRHDRHARLRASVGAPTPPRVVHASVADAAAAACAPARGRSRSDAVAFAKDDDNLEDNIDDDGGDRERHDRGVIVPAPANERFIHAGTDATSLPNPSCRQEVPCGWGPASADERTCPAGLSVRKRRRQLPFQGQPCQATPLGLTQATRREGGGAGVGRTMNCTVPRPLLIQERLSEHCKDIPAVATAHGSGGWGTHRLHELVQTLLPPCLSAHAVDAVRRACDRDYHRVSGRQPGPANWSTPPRIAVQSALNVAFSDPPATSSGVDPASLAGATTRVDTVPGSGTPDAAVVPSSPHTTTQQPMHVAAKSQHSLLLPRQWLNSLRVAGPKPMEAALAELGALLTKTELEMLLAAHRSRHP